VRSDIIVSKMSFIDAVSGENVIVKLESYSSMSEIVRTVASYRIMSDQHILFVVHSLFGQTRNSMEPFKSLPLH
jgi:hypothetical protein